MGKKCLFLMLIMFKIANQELESVFCGIYIGLTKQCKNTKKMRDGITQKIEKAYSAKFDKRELIRIIYGKELSS